MYATYRAEERTNGRRGAIITAATHNCQNDWISILPWCPSGIAPTQLHLSSIHFEAHSLIPLSSFPIFIISYYFILFLSHSLIFLFSPFLSLSLWYSKFLKTLHRSKTLTCSGNSDITSQSSTYTAYVKLDKKSYFSLLSQSSFKKSYYRK